MFIFLISSSSSCQLPNLVIIISSSSSSPSASHCHRLRHLIVVYCHRLPHLFNISLSFPHLIIIVFVGNSSSLSHHHFIIIIISLSSHRCLVVVFLISLSSSSHCHCVIVVVVSSLSLSSSRHRHRRHRCHHHCHRHRHCCHHLVIIVVSSWLSCYCDLIIKEPLSSMAREARPMIAVALSSMVSVWATPKFEARATTEKQGEATDHSSMMTVIRQHYPNEWMKFVHECS